MMINWWIPMVTDVSQRSQGMCQLSVPATEGVLVEVG